MNTTKYVCLTAAFLIIFLAHWALSLPSIAVRALTNRRKEADSCLEEVERLDRLRNPSKYRGR